MSMSFFAKLDAIDDLMKRGPHDLNFERDLAALLADSDVSNYFFEGLKDDASWLPILRRTGTFLRPPAAIGKGNGWLFPGWAPSRYLIEAARHAPAEVLAVAFEIPSVNNPRVPTDLIAAGCNMPGRIAVLLVPRLRGWFKAMQPLFMVDTARLFMEHLANEKEAKAARTVGRILLKLAPLRVHDLWSYDRVVQSYRASLGPLMPLRVLRDLSDALVRGWQNDDRGERPTASFWRRPSIENSDQNLMRGPDDCLVTAVRDAAVQAVTEEGVEVSAVVAVLEGYHQDLLRRISLHVLRMAGQIALPFSVERLLDPDWFFDEGLWHEFGLLLQASFAKMHPADRQRILAQIDSGPPQLSGSESSAARIEEDSDVIHRRSLWQIRRLSLVAPDLPPAWAQRLSEMVQRYGPPEHPTFLTYLSVGLERSAAAENPSLVGKSASDVKNQLMNTRPSPDLLGRQGLEDQLAEAVTAAPLEFASHAELFADVPPPYVWTLIDRLRLAHTQSETWDWTPVLALCRAVVGPEGRLAYGQATDASLHEREIPRSVLRLIEQGFKQTETRLQIRYRQDIWAILETLTSDPDPTGPDERAFLRDEADPAVLTQNSVRGMAMHNAVQYGLWLLRESGVASGELLEMPEVLRVLDHRLDPRIEPSLAVRSVYGQYFPWLLLISNTWARRNVGRIFPAGSEARLLHDAAWFAYLRYCAPYDETFEVLHAEYIRAIDNPPQWPDDQKEVDRGDVYGRLGEHFLTLYWRGLITLNPDDLIARYWAKAATPYRAHVVHTAGFAIGKWSLPVPSEIISRLQGFWEWRENEPVGTPLAPDSAELAEFGWWFASGLFDDEWSMAHLETVLRRARRVEPTFAVMTRLTEVAERHALGAARCLLALVQSTDDIDGLYLQEKEVEAILRAATANYNAEIQAINIQLLNRLGRSFLGLRRFASHVADDSEETEVFPS